MGKRKSSSKLQSRNWHLQYKAPIHRRILWSAYEALFGRSCTTIATWILLGAVIGLGVGVPTELIRMPWLAGVLIGGLVGLVFVTVEQKNAGLWLAVYGAVAGPLMMIPAPIEILALASIIGGAIGVASRLIVAYFPIWLS